MQARLDELMRRFDFDTWSAPREDSSLGWRFCLTGHELPGWRPHRIQTVDLTGDPPATLSVWRPARGNGALLAINVYECADAESARLHLLRLLAESAESTMTRLTGPGDVAFTAGPAGLLFARDNFTALVRSIERTPAPVAETAARLDLVLTAATQPVPGNGPDFASPDTTAVSTTAGPAVAISVDASDPAGGPVWFRFRSATGRLHLLHDRPLFTPAAEGPHVITVSAVGTTGVTDRSVRVAVAAD